MVLNIKAYLPVSLKGEGKTFEEKRGAYLAASREFLEHFREESKREHREGEGGRDVVDSITAMTDDLVTTLFSALSADLQIPKVGRLALVAVGGYGRGELNPYSDLDLMFLYSGKDSKRVEEVANRLLYFLWDLRLDVGYSIRTLSDCVEMANSDTTIKTALLDARLLTGSAELFAELKKLMVTQVLAKRSDAFIEEKLAEQRKRREKYGSSVYILEPNIKEGEGCLRDLHTALWVAKIKYKIDQPHELVTKGVFLEAEENDFYRYLDYLWRIRNELHYLAGRKNDQLTFDAQTSIARFFGYHDKGKTLAVEQFMQDFYLHANEVEHFCSQLINRCSRRDEKAHRILGYFTRRPVGDGLYVMKGELVVPDETVIEKNPVRLIKIFEYAQKQEVAISIGAKKLVRDNLELVNDKFRRSKEANASFINILQSEKEVGGTLQQMHHLGFLSKFIPEFERINCKVQHDVYHIYTVDTHTLFAVDEIVKLWRGDHKDNDKLALLTQLSLEIDKRWLLLLAVLLHDTGKGSGGGHAEIGAELSRTVARRMGLSKEDGDRLQFLVRHHLLMAHIAQRRDLHDERMIIQFARQMEKSENLKMLYLLTYADIKAVGPDVWTDWKALLLQELYEKAFAVLERGDFKLEASGDRVKRVKKAVFDILAEDYPHQLIKDELECLSTRHLLSYKPDIIAGHLRILLSLNEEPLVLVSHEEEKGYTNCTVCTYDVPGLFSKITGVMAANGMNILGAQIHTNRNEKVLDILQVNSPQGFVITEESRWERFREDLRQVVAGNVRVSALVRKRYRPSILAEKAKPTMPARVEIDNEVSSDYTVIDIYAHDKIGLLYSITSTLTRLGLYIGVSKISTKVDQVADVFYVKDIFAQKITDPLKLEEIRKELMGAVSRD